jgi:hypothetical protein
LTGSAERGLLALDFDGVICDAFTECAAVTWYAPRAEATVSGESLATLIARIPTEFLEVFRQVRRYARTLDDFMVALHPAAYTIIDQAGFESLRQATPADQRARLTESATNLREFWRTSETELWLDLHTLYAGIAELMAQHHGRLVVVTAKDAASVRRILSWHQLLDGVTEVLGECHDKGAAVVDVAERANVAINRLTFIDDNVPNVCVVATTGAVTWWARWGYHTAEHAELASRFGVQPLDLDGLSVIAA